LAEEETHETTEHGGSDTPVASLDARDEIVRLERQLSERDGQLKRLAADFDNHKRRTEQAQKDQVRFAAMQVLEALLPVVDNFELALGSMKPGAAVEDVLKGVQMIHRQFQEVLERSGVSAMEAVGKPFDPNLHEAMGQIDTTEMPDQTVLNEIRKGYVLHGKVLRHAWVQVAVNASDAVKIAMQAGEARPHVNDDSKEEQHG
jgi:molecular chaperone GrpE